MGVSRAMNGEKAAGETGFRTRILVIDDEKRMRDGCHKVLTREGFKVARAKDGRSGLDQIEHEHFDIVLLDLMMPGLSGLDILPQIRSLDPDSVVIVITGYATLEHAVEAMRKGAFDLIPKPFAPDHLRLVVSKAIEYSRALKDIAEEKSRVRVLVDRLSDGVMATDTQKRIVLANPAFLRMVGYRGQDVATRQVHEVVQSSELNHMIDQALSTAGEEMIELTSEFSQGGLGQDKEKILGVRCVPFRDRLGRNLGTVTVLHDITTLRKMDQLKSTFVSMVSHEIQSPMNSVLAQLKIILDGLAGDLTEKQRDILGRASEKIKTLSALSAELLDLAKIESGLISHEMARLDFTALLKDQVRFHQEAAKAKGLQLILEPLPDLPLVYGSKHSLEEVLSNLISNAIKYTREGGTVTVSAEVENGYVRLSVSDTGIGIAKQEMTHIFDRFYRVRDEKTRSIHGTGLGLPIVKSIVEAHNGVIHVESEPDRGSTFHVFIPLLSSEPGEA